MKKTFGTLGLLKVFFLTLSVFLFINTVKAQPPVKIYVFSGQSNMGGTANLPQEIIDWRDNPANDVLYLPYGETDFVDLTGARKEVVFAYYVDQYWKSIDPQQQIAIVRYNVPGTGVSYWGVGGRQNRNQWSPGYTSQGGGNAGLMPLIELSKTLITGDGKTWEGAGFIWYQGENDCLLMSSASMYAMYFTDLVNGFDPIIDNDTPLYGDDPANTHVDGIKDILNNPDMPVVLARVSNQFTGWGGSGGNDWTPAREAVREQHMLFAERNQPAAWINVDDVPCTDGYHYDGAATWRYCKRFSDEYLKLVNLPVIKPKDGQFNTYRNTKFMDSLLITIAAPFSNATIRYTTDGTDPDGASTQYTAPFKIYQSTTIKAKAFYPDQADSEIASKTYTKLTPLPAQTTNTLSPGVRYQAYNYSSSTFPGFENVTAGQLNQEGITDKFDHQVLATYNNRTILSTGFINITQSGVYSFEIITAEDARLFIDDQLVIDHQDIPGNFELSGEVALKAGYHRIRVEYLHYNGSAHFFLRYYGGDVNPAIVVQPGVLFHEVDGANHADIVLSRSNITLGSASGSYDVFTIASSIDPLTITSDQAWLDVSSGSGALHEKIIMTANSENNTGSDRTATVTVSGGSAVSKTITVTQKDVGAGLTVSTDTVTVAYKQHSTETFDITTSQSWNITCQNQDWFYFSENAGTGNATITVTVKENDTRTPRDTKFTVTAADGSFQHLIITQNAADPYLSAVQFEVIVKPDGGFDQFGFIDILGNVPWSASTDVSWINMSTSSGNGLGRVYFETDPYTEATERSAYIVISSPGMPSQKVKIIQQGTDPSLSVSTNTVYLKESTAGTVYITCNQAWSASTGDPWLSVITYQDNRIGIYADGKNNTGSPRTGTVTISSAGVPDETITVIQLDSGNIFYTESDHVTLDYKMNSTGAVKVYSNMIYGVSTGESWINVSMETIDKQQFIIIESNEANATGADRSGTVTVSATGMPDMAIAVTQLVSPEVTALPAAITIGSEIGNDNTFSITSNTNWNIATDQDWVDLSTFSGSMDENITVTANKKNYSTSTRMVTLTITAVDVTPQTVTVTQDASATYLTSTENEITIGSTSGSTGTFDILSDISWNAVSSQTWLDVDMGSGTGDQSITLTVNADNTDPEPRYASVTLSGSGVEDVVILVIQEGASNVIAYDYFDIDLGGSQAIALDDQNTGEGWSAGYNVQNSRQEIPGYNISNADPITYPNLRSSENYATGGIQYVGCGRGLDVSNTFATYEASNGEIGLDGTTLYFSCLAREDDNDNRWEIFMKDNGTNWNGNRIIEAGIMSGGYWGIDVDGTEDASSVPVLQGDSVLLVLKMQFDVASTTVNLFVNPTVGSPEPVIPDATRTSSVPLTFNGIGIYFGSDEGSGSVDEIRFGASFEDVTPITGAAVNYDITFNVDDGSNPVSGASVTFNGETLPTNGSGQVIFTGVDIGVNQPFTITQTGFFEENGLVHVVDQNVTKNVSITAFTGYDVTFTVTDGTNPIDAADVTFNSQALQTNASGQVTFAGVTPGAGKAYSISKTGFDTSNGTVDVDDDENINVVLTEQTYFLTVNNGTGEGNYSAGTVVDIVADAPVTGKEFAAWTGDVTNITDVNAASTTITMPAAATTITATYTDLTYTITFNVDTNGTPLQDAAVTFNSETIHTDASGQAVFNDVIYGTGMAYSITKTGFNTESGNVDATTNVIENVTMTKTPPGTYTVTFTVDDGTNPLQNANVGFNSQDILTNASGEAIFNGIANGLALPYTVTKTGYDTVNSTLDVADADVDETVSLTLTPSTPDTFTLTVNNGSGSGKYTEGETVTVTANAAPAEQEFSHWSGGNMYVDDSTNATTIFTVPAMDVTLAAVYKDIIDEIRETAIMTNVYPNPVKEILNITATSNISSVEIMDVFGKCILQKNVTGQHCKINVLDITAGIYFVRLQFINGIQTFKLLVE